MKVLVIGGNRFFGRHLVELLLEDGADVTLLNRGNLNDQFGDQVQRLKADRQNPSALKEAIHGNHWDLIYDQACYTADEAKTACELFEGRTKRYIVTSSESVYDNGVQLKESAFDPEHYDFNEVADRNKNYQEAKRQVEVVFTKEADFEVAIVRPSLVVGLDDYTDRLKWHVQRVAQSLPIYFPNIEARSDFIRSDQAGRALKIVGLSRHLGPVNFTTPGTMKLKELISLCELATGKKANLASSRGDNNHSPYGGTAEKSMDTEILRSLGFVAPASLEWMKELVFKIAENL
jgi:nucleoside-diphosphate-sugar epimerase